MITVTVSSAVPHEDGIQLGLVVRHTKAGWVRFAATVLVAQTLTYHERVELVEALLHDRESERLEEQGLLTLFDTFD